MANSWNGQPNPQAANPIRFFDPSQFQAPAASIATPATLKHNQHRTVTAGDSNSHSGNVPQPQPSPATDHHQQQLPAYQGGNAWGGGGGGAVANDSSTSGTTPQDAHSSWTSWGSWDWNQQQDQQNAMNDQSQPYHHQQQQQQHDQQQFYQQQPYQQHQQNTMTDQSQPYQQQQQPQHQHYQHQQHPHPQTTPQQPIHQQPPFYQPQPPVPPQSSPSGGDTTTTQPPHTHQQFNAASWDTATNQQHAQPGHHATLPPEGNGTDGSQLDMQQYNQPHSAGGSSYFGGDSNTYGDQNQFYAGGHDQLNHHHQVLGESGVTASQGEGHQGDNEATEQQQQQQQLDHHQLNSSSSSMGLDQGQSQVLYDQPSALPPQDPLASFSSEQGPWLADNSQQQQPDYSHSYPHPHLQQQDGMGGGLVGVGEEARGDNNVDEDNVNQGDGHQHHHYHSLQPAPVAASNASPSFQQDHHPPSDSFPSIPTIATTSPSHPYHHNHPSYHPHHLQIQSPDAVSADPGLNEYCDNDSDGGTVAGFFGRGDDDGDVSSDAQRSNRAANLNTSGSSDTTAGASGVFLNVGAAGKSLARENSEISNASLTTVNTSVDDAGKEHLDELQALVQRMENVDIANRNALQASAEKGGNQQEVPVTVFSPSSSGDFGHHQQQTHGDFSGFGSESSLKTSQQAPPPPRPPPTLNLDTNPVADRPSSPDGGIAASSESSGGSGASGTSSGLTDWEIVPSQSQMTHSRNSSLDNTMAATLTDKPDGSISQEPGRDGNSGRKDGGGVGGESLQQSPRTSSSQQQHESFNPSSMTSSHSGQHGDNLFQGVSSYPEDESQLSSPNSQAKPTAVYSNPTTTTSPSSSSSTVMSSSQQQLSPEGPLSFQPSKSPKMASSGGSHMQPPPPPPPSFMAATTAASYFNPPLPISNPNAVSPEKPVNMLPPASIAAPTFSQPKVSPTSIPQPPPAATAGPRPKLTSEDGVRPPGLDKKAVPPSSSSHPPAGSEQKFRRPHDPPGSTRREGDNSGDKMKSSASERRHQSAFHPIQRPRQTTMSPATTLWDTDSGSSSNILLAPAMPLIIPALNPYSASAQANAKVTSTSTNDAASAATTTMTPAATATTSLATDDHVTKSARGRVPSKEPEQTPRSRYGDRDRGRDRPEDVNRSFDSLDELDSGPDYRTPRDRPAKSERPDSRADRRYDYDYPSGRGERPMSRTEGAAGYKDDPQNRRNRGGYYADSYYDEHYDRPRSRHDEAAKNSRPSSRSGGQEVDRPGSRGGDYDRERDYGYRDRNRGYYNYDSYGGRRDYYGPEDRDSYYRYYRDNRDRDARYSRGYYEEYYGKNADYYQQQHQQQQQRQARPETRGHDGGDRTGSQSRSQSHQSRSESHGRSDSQSRSQSRGHTPGPADHQSDYYSRGSRPASRQDYARDYYRGSYGGYDYAGYYDGYGYDPYAGYGYAGYTESATQGYDQGRMTPPKYAYPHVRACFGPNGQLVKVLPNRPGDGQPAMVERLEVQAVLETCQEAEDLKQFPGPLTREGSHKKDVLLLCQRKALACMEDVDMVDRESAQLVWKLLELLIKQNGSVVGTDLSDLLLDGHEPSSLEYSAAGTHRPSRPQSTDGLEMMTEDSLDGDGSSRNSPALASGSGGVVRMDRTLITPSNAHQQREDFIARFRHLLLYGRKKDAIECAMKHNLWGHALFLASKMDTRTHASVMIRFANSAMRMNDPLQTLYQLMSGRQPASVTCVVDERWGDWRPHLAMILSNQTSRPDLDRKSITTLGDTLAAKGCLHASHFCYLMAQVPFGTYDKKTSKIVLVGASHYLPLREFASMDAIQCTEVYEYSQTLANPAFCLPHFQLYKYLYACRLVDFGLVTEAFLYCEVMASAILQYPAYFQPSFVHLVFELASQLKYSDPSRHNSHVDDHVEPVWIQQVEGLMAQYADGTIQTVSGTVTPCDLRSNVDSSGGGGDGRGYQPHPYQAHAADTTTMATTTATGDYNGQGTGDVQAQGSGSGGFETQEEYQYSQQPGQTESSAGQHYHQDTTTTNDPHQQQHQQYPGYDETDAGAATHHQHQQHYQDYSTPPDSAVTHQAGYDQQQQQPDYNQWQQQHQQQQQQQQQFYGNSMDLTSSQASSGFSGDDGMAGHMPTAMPGHMTGAMPPRASISTNETEDDDDNDDDDDEDDDDEQNGPVTGFDYFGNANQRVVVPPSRFRSPSESSASGGRRRRTTSGSSTGSVKASPHKTRTQPPPQTSSSSSSMPGAGGDLKDGSGGGWFGGLFSKFGRKGKNEMILPDDKDPAIVWDPQKKKWLNADGTEEVATVAAPPPKDIDLMAGGPSSAPPPAPIPGAGPSGAPPPGMPPPPTGLPGANKFSLKAKGVRNQYVDVNNPKPVAAPQGLFNVAPPMGNGAPTGALPQVFLPGSTTTTTNNNNNNANLLNVPTASTTNDDLSRSSSLSSVNQEVQRLTGQTDQDSSTPHQPPPAQPAPTTTTNAMPMLFNPATLNPAGGHSGGPAPAGPGLKYGQRRAYPKKK